MEQHFGQDLRRINHAYRVLAEAEKLLAKEPGADEEIVVAAAILHDIGIHAAEKKYNSNAGKYQEIEGPPIAERLLHEVGFSESKVAEVLEIIAHHHSGGIKTNNFQIIWQADIRVNQLDGWVASE